MYVSAFCVPSDSCLQHLPNRQGYQLYRAAHNLSNHPRRYNPSGKDMEDSTPVEAGRGGLVVTRTHAKHMRSIRLPHMKICPRVGGQGRAAPARKYVDTSAGRSSANDFHTNAIRTHHRLLLWWVACVCTPCSNTEERSKPAEFAHVSHTRYACSGFTDEKLATYVQAREKRGRCCHHALASLLRYSPAAWVLAPTVSGRSISTKYADKTAAGYGNVKAARQLLTCVAVFVTSFKTSRTSTRRSSSGKRRSMAGRGSGSATNANRTHKREKSHVSTGVRQIRVGMSGTLLRTPLDYAAYLFLPAYLRMYARTALASDVSLVGRPTLKPDLAGDTIRVVICARVVFELSV